MLRTHGSAARSARGISRGARRRSGMAACVALACVGAQTGAALVGSNVAVPVRNDRSASLTDHERAAVAASLDDLTRKLGWLDVSTDPRTVSVLDRLEMATAGTWSGELVVAGLFADGDSSLCERLLYRRSDLSVVVDSPRRLRGLVRIEDRQSALNCARLLTSPATMKCFRQPWWCEVMPESAVSDALLYGREYSPWVPGSYAASGTFGILSEEDWERSGLAGAAVVDMGNRFVVKRPLVRLSYGKSSTNRVCLIEHTVWPDGRLSRALKGRVLLPHVELSVPFEM